MEELPPARPLWIWCTLCASKPLSGEEMDNGNLAVTLSCHCPCNFPDRGLDAHKVRHTHKGLAGGSSSIRLCHLLYWLHILLQNIATELFYAMQCTVNCTCYVTLVL